MSNRPIVRDAEVLGGRWTISGTEIPVADVCNDFRLGHNGGRESYHFQGLSAAEISAALDFPFPAIRPTEVELIYGIVSVNCECGETTQQNRSSWLEELVDCVCGRTWRIRLVAELVSDPVKQDGVVGLVGK